MYTFRWVKTSVIMQKGESQNGWYKKTKHAAFFEKRTFLIPWYAHMRVCIRGKKCSFFGKFGLLCFLVTPVLRFARLLYYRRNMPEYGFSLTCIFLYDPRRFYSYAGIYGSEKPPMLAYFTQRLFSTWSSILWQLLQNFGEILNKWECWFKINIAFVFLRRISDPVTFVWWNL